MKRDPDPFEEGQRAARKNIPAEANPYQDGSEEHSLWSAGHEQVAGAAEANESEGTLSSVIPGRELSDKIDYSLSEPGNPYSLP
jgi:hypothetical protein